MGQIHKTVFVSYRRTTTWIARYVHFHLTMHGYDVFLDYESIGAGLFDETILQEIESRAHFLIILTTSTLERCTNPDDWVRREIEYAMEKKRNIVPLLFDNFEWNDIQRNYLEGDLKDLQRYQSLRVLPDFAEQSMEVLRSKYLNIPIKVGIQPYDSASSVSIESGATNEQIQATAHFERGLQHLSMTNWDFAGKDFWEAIRLNPFFVEPYAYIAWTLVRQGIAMSVEHKGRLPNRIELVDVSILIRRTQDRKELEAIEKGLRLDDKYPLLYLARAYLNMFQRKFGDALRDLQKYRSLTDDNLDAELVEWLKELDIDPDTFTDDDTGLVDFLTWMLE